VFQYFTSHEDEGLARAVREGRAREFAGFIDDPSDVPDPQDEETFRRSRLEWDELAQPKHAEMFRWYRSLIRLRREHPSLRPGMLGDDEVTYSEESRWIMVKRGDFTLVLNFGGADVSLPLDANVGRTPLLANMDGIEVRNARADLGGKGISLFGPTN